MEIITGYTGKKHITPEHDRDIHIGTYGDNSYVLSTGSDEDRKRKARIYQE